MGFSSYILFEKPRSACQVGILFPSLMHSKTICNSKYHEKAKKIAGCVLCMKEFYPR